MGKNRKQEKMENRKKGGTEKIGKNGEQKKRGKMGNRKKWGAEKNAELKKIGMTQKKCGGKMGIIGKEGKGRVRT